MRGFGCSWVREFGCISTAPFVRCDAQHLPNLDQGDEGPGRRRRRSCSRTTGSQGALLEELDKQVAQLEDATQASIGGLRDHIGGLAELKVVAGEVVELVNARRLQPFRFRVRNLAELGSYLTSV